MGLLHIRLMPTLFSREMSQLWTHSEINNKSRTELKGERWRWGRRRKREVVGRERELHLAVLHCYESACCQLYSCCPAANLGRQLSAFARNYVGSFSGTPFVHSWDKHKFSLGFLPLPRRWVRSWIPDLCYSKPFLRLQDQLSTWFQGFQWESYIQVL